MPLGLATLPLGPEQLRALADADYTIVDHAARTPGLLIVQAPDDARQSGDAKSALPATAGVASPVTEDEAHALTPDA